MRETITLRLDGELKAWLVEEARLQNRSVNNLVETILMRSRDLDPLLDAMRDERPGAV